MYKVGQTVRFKKNLHNVWYLNTISDMLHIAGEERTIRAVCTHEGFECVRVDCKFSAWWVPAEWIEEHEFLNEEEA